MINRIMKYYIISGEASGDLHGANLIDAIKELDENAVFQFWGGDKMMKSANKKPIKHISELAFMGFVEVVANLRTILNNISLCKSDILQFKPDALILIDYPGFNLRIAKWAKKEGIKVFYYISPQIWAWKPKRIYSIMNSVEAVYAILPFEKDYYKKYGFDINFVGHPLLDEINKNTVKPIPFESEKPVIALLPGSRKQEISRMLPIMLSICKKFPQYSFKIAAAPAIELSYYQEFLKQNIADNKNIEVIKGNTYGLLNQSKAAIVTSGTATLETALFKVPQVVGYKGNYLSYLIAKRLISVKYISLVNLILDKPLLKELIQVDFTPEQIEKELKEILSNKGRERITEGYKQLEDLLSSKEGASKTTAKNIIQSTP